jgi:transporter family-2 protein
MNASTSLILLIPFLAGVGIPVQAGINGQLALRVDSPIMAALVSFAAGTIALLALVLLLRLWPSAEAWRGVQPWHLIGGLLGAVFIASTAFSASRIDAVLMTALVLAGQLTTAMLLDHFGALGFAQKSISLGRVGGLGLILAGIWLIRRG